MAPRLPPGRETPAAVMPGVPLPAARLAQGGAHVRLGDIGAQGRALGQVLDHPAGVGAIARAAIDRNAAARRFYQHLEGVLDQGDVAAVGSDHGAQFGVV